MGTKRHPDFDRYVEACNYPGRIDPPEVERHLRAYVAALGIQRDVVQIKRGWQLEELPDLDRTVREIASKVKGSASRAARAASAASEARAAIDARAARAASAASEARQHSYGQLDAEGQRREQARRIAAEIRSRAGGSNAAK